MKNTAENHSHGHGTSSKPLRQALGEHFSPEFGKAVLDHFKVNGVIENAPGISHELKAALTAISQHQEHVRIPLAKILLTASEFRNKKGEELKKAGEQVRDRVKNLLIPLLH